jgi:hypothetical protein
LINGEFNTKGIKVRVLDLKEVAQPRMSAMSLFSHYRVQDARSGCKRVWAFSAGEEGTERRNRLSAKEEVLNGSMIRRHLHGHPVLVSMTSPKNLISFTKTIFSLALKEKRA